MIPLSVPLDAIVGLSPRNVRGEVEAVDVAGLMASIEAVGLLQPLVVEWVDAGADDNYAVVEGGRRWIALRSLAAAGRLAQDAPVAVMVIDVGAAEAREISLAANVMRRDLHPVEEFEAFARLAADGLTVERIAADFGATTRFVRQRLALDRLSPRVRALWRDGNIKADVAVAFTRAPSHEAQDDYLARVEKGRAHLYPGNVAEFFATKGARRADSPEALFVGLDVYQAAGGAVDDNLFQDWSLCLDGALLARLARDKMMAEGLAILERTGFGTCLIQEDVEDAWKWGRLPVDVTDGDKAELAALETRARAAHEKAIDEDDWDGVAAGFAAEKRAIHLRSILRGNTEDERARAAIFVAIDSAGQLRVDYGLTPPAAGKASTAPPRSTGTNAVDTPIAATADAKPPTKAVVECLDNARDRALATLIADRPALAILLCTAALRTNINRSPLRIAARGRNGAIADAVKVSFAGALAELLALPSYDRLLDTFARSVGQTVLTFNGGAMYDDRTCEPKDALALAQAIAHYAGDAFEPAQRQALNYPAYFTAATRATAIAAIEAAGGDANAARKAKADVAAATAAELTRDKGWLPVPLRRPKPFKGATLALEAPTLVDAMAAAIEADSPADPRNPLGLPAPIDAQEAIRDFVALHCATGGGMVEEWTLFDAFIDRMPAAWDEQAVYMSDFVNALAANGIELSTVKGREERYFIDIDLIPLPDALAEAAE